MPPSLGDEVAEQGWCTGAVIAHDMVPDVAQYLAHPGTQPTTVNADDWLVVVSQTCDVVAGKIEAEPFVEVLHCTPIAKLRAGRKNLGSTRYLDFKPNRVTHEDVALTAHAVPGRYLIPRDFFRARAPDSARHLSDTATARVLAWYSLRYGRPCWPDSFVSRIGNATQEALEKAIEPLKDDIAEVRVGIAEKYLELGKGESYHVAVYFIVEEAVWTQDVEGRTAIHEAFAKFISELNGCYGIEVNDELSGVVSGCEFTWQETRATDEWNFANLSHRE